MRPLSLLLFGFLALWTVVIGLIFLLWDVLGLTSSISRENAVLLHSIATAICLTPMVATLVWTHRVKQSAPDQQMLALFGGIGLRMFFVLGVGLVLTRTVQLLSQNDMAFWIWVLATYLITLAMEVVVLVHAANPPQGKQGIN